MAGSKIFDRVEDFRIVAGFVDYAREERFLHEVPEGHLLQEVLREPSDLDRYDRNALHAAFSRLQQLVHQRMSLAARSDPGGLDDRPTMPPPGEMNAGPPDRMPPPMPAEIRSRLAALRSRIAAMHEDAADAASRSEELLALRVHFNRFAGTMARIGAAVEAAPPQVRGEAAVFLDRVERDLAAAERILRTNDTSELDAAADEVMADLSMAWSGHLERSEEGRREARILERLGKVISEAIVSDSAFTVRLAVIEAHLRAQRLLEPVPAFAAPEPLPPPRAELPTLSGDEPFSILEPARGTAPERSRESRRDADIAERITRTIDDCQRLLGIFGRDEVSGHLVQRYRQLQFIMASRFDEERTVELIFAIRSDLEVVDRIHRARGREAVDEEAFRVLVQEVRGEGISAAEKLELAGDDAAVMRAYAQRLVDDYAAFRLKPEPHCENLRRLLLEVHVEAARVLIPYGRIAGPGQDGDSGGSPGPAGGGGMKEGASIGGFTAGAEGSAFAPLDAHRFGASLFTAPGIAPVMPSGFAVSAAALRCAAFALA